MTLAVEAEKVSPIEVGADSQVGPACVDTRKVWVKISSITLYDEHKEMILNGSKLNNVVINAAWMLLKEQFPELMGLQLTLLLKKQQPRFQREKLYVQIMFDREDHLIVLLQFFKGWPG